jgi:hypothetical protein
MIQGESYKTNFATIDESEVKEESFGPDGDRLGIS